jgi:two-component system, NarL family, sensor kinase
MLLDRFAAALTPAEAEYATLVADYAAWRGVRPGEEFTPGGDDDVEIRNYLLDLRIDGAGREAIQARLAALKRFYGWARDEGLIEYTPFDEFNFDRPLLDRDQIRRRPDALGTDPRGREVARLRALNRLADQLNRSTDIQTTLDVTLETLIETLGLQTAWVFLWDESGLTHYLSAAPAPHDFALCAASGLPPGLEHDLNYYLREPPDCQCQYLLREGRLNRAVNIVECTRLQDSAESDEDNRGLLFHASVPLISQGRPVGIVNVATDEWQFLGAADLQLLSAAGAQLSITLERARLFARSADLGAMEERMRLAREIHDTLAQGLTAITLNLETADALLEAGADGDRPRQAVQRALGLSRANLEEARRSVLDLRAAPLEGRSLAEALAALASAPASEAAGARVIVEAESDGRPLPPRVEAGLYRIAQEAVANALRHARAERITLRLAGTPNDLRLAVEDDGCGFDAARVPADRYGLIGMSERVRLLGGQLHLESTPGEGTRVEVVIPLDSHS